ncbi:unnamed protein product [Peniophora sp. CBMAI 1063]|nr:unnamed protein product [Peniophora sp. CBMAI 1063]
MIQHLEDPTQLVWLVTGASSGLGLALVKCILARGDRVVATARDPSKLDALMPVLDVLPGRLYITYLDVTDTSEKIQSIMDAAILRWGRIDVLVNNAGIVEAIGPAEELGTTDLFRSNMETNFFGVVKCTNAILPHMRARREGTIVIVGSRSAFKTDAPGIGAYGASKAAAHAYGETIASELSRLNIRVTIVVPGLFRTPFNYASPVKPKFDDYNFFHDHAPAYLKMRRTTPEAADPEKGMDVVVDVVRGEGRAVGTGEWPLWLALGDDALTDVKFKLSNIGKTLAVWGDAGRGLKIE